MLSFLLTNIGYAQQQDNQFYLIENLGDNYSQAEIIEALEAADLCGFHYINEKRKIQFDDGAVVELHSSEDNNNMSQTCFIEKSPAHKDEFWKISDNGHLIRIKQTYGK
jgi:hypothetical protein